MRAVRLSQDRTPKQMPERKCSIELRGSTELGDNSHSIHYCAFITPLHKLCWYKNINYKYNMWPKPLRLFKLHRPEMTQVHVDDHQCWQRLCLLLRPRDQTSVLTAEEPAVSEAEGGTSGQVHSQEHAGAAHHIFIPKSQTVKGESGCGVWRRRMGQTSKTVVE